MFGIGMTELLVIMAVALVVFGPKRLPELARSMGRALGEFRNASTDLRQALSETPATPPAAPASPTPPTATTAPQATPGAEDEPDNEHHADDDELDLSATETAARTKSVSESDPSA